jgi:hypothetical protein
MKLSRVRSFTFWENEDYIYERWRYLDEEIPANHTHMPVYFDEQSGKGVTLPPQQSASSTPKEAMRAELLSLMKTRLGGEWGPDPYVCRWCGVWLE